MGVFGKPPYDRAASLRAAAKASAKRNWRRAIGHYLEVLEHEPDDLDTLAKMAPLQARMGAPRDSWRSFAKAGEGYAQIDFIDRAAAIYESAIRVVPREAESWRRLAALHLERGLRRDAALTLVKGSRHFRKRADLATAVDLLTSAFRIEPWRLDVSLQLAEVLRKSGDRPHAKRILQELVTRTTGSQRRTVRAHQLRLSPTPAALWRWLWGK